MCYKEIKKHCKNCGKLLILRNNRDVTHRNFCSHSCNGSFQLITKHKKDPTFRTRLIQLCNTVDANKKKSLPGNKNGRWINDRTKLKNKRCYKEEKDFMKEVLKDRNYTCELTGKKGGILSVHHKNSYKDFPNLRFDKNNVIVIQRYIHKLFHTEYGTMFITEEKWNNFVESKKYYACSQ